MKGYTGLENVYTYIYTIVPAINSIKWRCKWRSRKKLKQYKNDKDSRRNGFTMRH